MSRYREFDFPLIPIEDAPQPGGFDAVRQIAQDEARAAFTELSDPDADVASFLVLATERGTMLAPLIAPEGTTGDDLTDYMVPSLLAGTQASACALAVTVWTAPIASLEGGARPSEAPDRVESLAVMVADRDGRRETITSKIDRRPGAAPALSDFRSVAAQLPPAFERAISHGFSQEGPGLPATPSGDQANARMDEFEETLAQAMEAVLDWVGGPENLGPCLVLAVPELPQLAPFLLPGEELAERRADLEATVARLLPVALALVTRSERRDALVAAALDGETAERFMVMATEQHEDGTWMIPDVRSGKPGDADQHLLAAAREALARSRESRARGEAPAAEVLEELQGEGADG